MLTASSIYVGHRYVGHASAQQRSSRMLASVLDPGQLSVPDPGQLLSNRLVPDPVEEETLHCVQYSGPCYFMNHPNGDAPVQPVQAARLESDGSKPLQPPILPLHPFSLHDLHLLPGTRFHRAQQINVAWLHQLDPDRMLYYYRNLSGIAQPHGVRPHGGWDGAGTGLRGHILGHWMAAASMAAASSGDELLRSRLDYVVRSLEACQAAINEGGYLAGFPPSEFRQMETLPAPRCAWLCSPPPDGRALARHPVHTTAFVRSTSERCRHRGVCAWLSMFLISMLGHQHAPAGVLAPSRSYPPTRHSPTLCAGTPGCPTTSCTRSSRAS